MTEADVIPKVRAFITRSFPHAHRTLDVEDESDVLGHHGLDSMALMELVTFLEDEFEISVSEQDVRSSDLDTLKGIAAYVCRKTATTT